MHSAQNVREKSRKIMCKMTHDGESSSRVQGDFLRIGKAAVRFDLMRPCAFNRSYMT